MAFDGEEDLKSEMLRKLREVLSDDEISDEDDFWNAGADSLTIMKYLSIIKQDLKLDISLSDAFKAKNISSLYEFAKQPDAQDTQSGIEKRVKENFGLGEGIEI